MKKILGAAFGIMLMLSARLAYAIPSLQLDIAGGTYDPITETIIAATKSFGLYAYLIPDNNLTTYLNYYISAAFIPSGSGNLGSSSFDGLTIPVTGGMVSGTPTDLPAHGIFLLTSMKSLSCLEEARLTHTMFRIER